MQLSVFLDDRPGTLAGVAELLGSHGINLFALSLAEGIGHGYVRMVVDRHDEAKQILHDAGELTMEREVLLVEMPNRPGSLGQVARALSDYRINIEYAYCASGPNVDRGLIVVRTDPIDAAFRFLQELT